MEYKGYREIGIAAGLLLIILAGCGGDFAEVETDCDFELLMEGLGCDCYNTEAVCVGSTPGGADGPYPFDGRGTFVCRPGDGRKFEVETDAACYLSPGAREDNYPMFYLNGGCPKVEGLKEWESNE